MKIRLTVAAPSGRRLTNPFYFALSSPETETFQLRYAEDLYMRQTPSTFVCQEGPNQFIYRNGYFFVNETMFTLEDSPKAINHALAQTFCHFFRLAVGEDTSFSPLWAIRYGGYLYKEEELLRLIEKPSLLGSFTVERKGQSVSIVAPNDDGCSFALWEDSLQLTGKAQYLNGTFVLQYHSVAGTEEIAVVPSC